jgi:uncharacterized repeat protein (TIGR03803 family)
VLALVLAFSLLARPAHAQTESILYSFPNTFNPQMPTSSLIFDIKGNLYGTTQYGGENYRGSVFELSPPSEPGGPWVETTLYSFKGPPTDGQNPSAGLLIDSEGNLYGNAGGGGFHNSGIVFEITPAGTEKILHYFKGSPDDGSGPAGVLVRDSQGNFYGTTGGGGTNNDGTIFKLTPAGKESILYNFSGKPDGRYPVSGVIRDSQGNLYGTTLEGGANNGGSVFKFSAGVETVLHSFHSTSTDGQFPYDGLLLDSAGNLYGTTSNGGTSNYGVVYEITAAGAEEILYTFKGGEHDGAIPFCTLIMDSQGNLYGTTSVVVNFPGPFGTVFEITPQGKEIILHKFTNSPDGYSPMAGLVMDSHGNLYGTTEYGGNESSGTNDGTVFEVVP